MMALILMTYTPIILVFMGLSVLTLLLILFVGGAMLGPAIDAGDGDESSSYGSRIGTVILMVLVSALLPGIGIFIAISILKNRHDMSYGKATLAYIVWNFLNSLILGLLLGVTYGILFVLSLLGFSTLLYDLLSYLPF